MGRNRVRSFERTDIPQVASLHARVFTEEAPPPAAYFEEFFFRTPFAEPDLRSLVCEDGAGRIIGFLAVTPRRYVFKGRIFRAAAAAKFMFDPEARSTTAGLTLFKTFLAGPQDFSIADLANEQGRTVWQAFRAETIWPYNMQWIRTLRPAPFRFLRAKTRRDRRFPGAPATRFLAALDGAAVRLWPASRPGIAPALSLREIDAGTMASALGDLTGRHMLRPYYDADSLGWLIERAKAKTAHGSLKCIGVWKDRNSLLGWFVYYLNPYGNSMVLQFVARAHAARDLMDCLLRHAAEGKAASVTGCLQPELMDPMSERTDISHHVSPYWMMVHAREAELLAAIHRGDALLTRLDGEWSMAFHGERVG